MKKMRGLAQIPLILGLLIMAVAVPVATKLVQQNQETRRQAAETNITCQVAGSLCNDLDCCSGLTCVTEGVGVRVCRTSTSCKPAGTTCYANSECCSDRCVNDGSGFKCDAPAIKPTSNPTPTGTDGGGGVNPTAVPPTNAPTVCAWCTNQTQCSASGGSWSEDNGYCSVATDGCCNVSGGGGGDDDGISCNTNEITLSVVPNPTNVTSPISFKIAGDASTWLGDDYGGGATGCTGTWNNKTCTSGVAGTYTWTHTWKHCVGDFDHCSSTCSKSINYAILAPPTVTLTPPTVTESPTLRTGCLNPNSCSDVGEVRCVLADAEIWKTAYMIGAEFGIKEIGLGPEGDFNCDGKVNLADREFWRIIYNGSL
jgi:hypothetical protein